MKPIRDAAWEAFASAPGDLAGQRIKDVRHEPLAPGGRARVTLFERVDDEGRPHPRLRLTMPPAEDPATPGIALDAPDGAPHDAEAFEAWLAGAWAEAQPALDAVDEATAPPGSVRYHVMSVRCQRRARFFDAAGRKLEAWLAGGALPRAAGDACLYALRRLEAEAYAGTHPFDDADTGTYHSFGHDAPFVHYLERLLETLPAEGTEALAVLDPEQQASVRRQREQARAHLDHLMRHKYAYHGIEEADIERSLGGLLIDRRTRQIASERPDTRDSLVPAYETLRVAPDAAHPHAGRWVHRDGQGGLRLDDGTPVEVPDDALRAVEVPADRLTFRRAPDSPLLRKGVRFDWDGNGYVQHEPVSWVSWAGHCDIKAILEQLGVTLADAPSVTEYRSDTRETTRFDRALLLEMVASALELGSVYARVDGSGYVTRGQHRFGGARNDSRPDRLQFQGPGPGRSFRWPLGGRQDTFTVTRITVGGGEVDPEAVFQRWLPDEEAVDFAANPRFLKTVEGDYNLIDVSGARLEVRVREDRFDTATGYPTFQTRDLVLDLGPEPAEARQFLGTHIQDAARREVYSAFLDRDRNEVEAIPYRYERGEDGRYAPRRVPGDTLRFPLIEPLTVTLSREMKRDDPESFQALLDSALRHGQNICADTDMAAEVWNGVVTRIEATREAENRASRVERWRIALDARFGDAVLEYLVRRDAKGRPAAFCPLVGQRWGREKAAPDFLWQDFPDVGSKGVEGADWVVNATMLERRIVEMTLQGDAPGGIYVYDDHVKNVFELLFCGLGGYPWAVVHQNKRYGFRDEAAWRDAVTRLEALRAAVRFEGGDGPAVA